MKKRFYEKNVFHVIRVTVILSTNDDVIYRKRRQAHTKQRMNSVTTQSR